MTERECCLNYDDAMISQRIARLFNFPGPSTQPLNQLEYVSDYEREVARTMRSVDELQAVKRIAREE